MLDDKSFTAENSRGFPGGFVGKVVDAVCGGALLQGKWHKIMADNYYITVDIAKHMRDNRNMLFAGTAQKKKLLIWCTSATPSAQNHRDNTPRELCALPGI